MSRATLRCALVRYVCMYVFVLLMLCSCIHVAVVVVASVVVVLLFMLLLLLCCCCCCCCDYESFMNHYHPLTNLTTHARTPHHTHTHNTRHTTHARTHARTLSPYCAGHENAACNAAHTGDAHPSGHCARQVPSVAHGVNVCVCVCVFHSSFPPIFGS